MENTHSCLNHTPPLFSEPSDDTKNGNTKFRFFFIAHFILKWGQPSNYRDYFHKNVWIYQELHWWSTERLENQFFRHLRYNESLLDSFCLSASPAWWWIWNPRVSWIGFSLALNGPANFASSINLQLATLLDHLFQSFRCLLVLSKFSINH